MEAKVYAYQKKHVRADGSVTYYNNKAKYVPVDKFKKSKILNVIKKIEDKETLEEIYRFISQFDERNQQPAENPRDPERN
jgi:hypothetical protein